MSGEGTVAGNAALGTAGQAGGGKEGESGTPSRVGDDVRFDWTQKLPGMCSGANFVGNVWCNLQNGGLEGPRIDGTLVLNLAGPSESQELTVESGSSLNLILDPMGRLLMSPVTGSLSCINKTFNGTVPERTFTDDETGLPFQIVLLLCGGGESSLSGAVTGSLDADGVLYGALSLTLGTCTCEGPFELRPQL